jgi:hypothetical protein
MQLRDKKLMEADSLLVQQKYAQALETFRSQITISEAQLDYTPDDFNWQLLILIRIQRAYKSLGGGTPAPLEKLIKYYEIVSRNHPKGTTLHLSREEALICSRVLEWLPKVQADGTLAAPDRAREKELADGILYLLGQNKDKYKLGVFYRKGF